MDRTDSTDTRAKTTSLISKSCSPICFGTTLTLCKPTNQTHTFTPSPVPSGYLKKNMMRWNDTWTQRSGPRYLWSSKCISMNKIETNLSRYCQAHCGENLKNVLWERCFIVSSLSSLDTWNLCLALVSCLTRAGAQHQPRYNSNHKSVKPVIDELSKSKRQNYIMVHEMLNCDNKMFSVLLWLHSFWLMISFAFQTFPTLPN